MVLRGSKVKPDCSYQDVETARARATKILQRKKKNLEKSGRDVVAALKRIERRDSEENEYVTREELLHIIRVFVEKIEADEKATAIAREKLQDAEHSYQKTILQFLSGGIAGAVARTSVAPIDRVKILMQTEKLMVKDGPPRYTSIFQTLQHIVKHEGTSRLWRGNMINCIRVVPYAATQFASFDFYKRKLTSDDGEMTIPSRLFAGSLAGATATSITHPLDTIRLRLSVQPELKGISGSVKSIFREGGILTFYKGYTATLLSLGPFIAVNFSAFDLIQQWSDTQWPQNTRSRTFNTVLTLGQGAAAGVFAQTICYPLDTIRRRMQLPGTHYSSTANAFATVLKTEGFGGFYKGMLPNALKVIPNNAIRFLVYDALKSYCAQLYQ